MFRLRGRIPLILAATAVTAGAGIATALPAGAAVSTLSVPASVSVESPVRLLNRGTVAEATVDVSCQSGANAYVGLSLSERVGSTTTVAAGDTAVDCTGDVQQVRILLTVPGGGRPLRKGTAYSQAWLNYCWYQCYSATEDKEIALVNG
jgi:hypothetical protein